MDVMNDLYKHQCLVLLKECKYLSKELPGTDHTCFWIALSHHLACAQVALIWT